ncbi:MAG: hypothetical protein AMXMBFR7_48850 [Planctomycetota bacterium]
MNAFTSDVGTDAMLRSRLLQWSATGDALEMNPMLKVGRLWVHYDHQVAVYQLSTEHGLLRMGGSAGLYILDLQQLRQRQPPIQTLSITFSPYEASALNLLGLRAVAILFPGAWTPELFEHFVILLKTEALFQVVFWPYNLGVAWNYAPEAMDWLAKFQMYADRNALRLSVMDLGGIKNPSLPEDTWLQPLIDAFVRTLNVDGNDGPSTKAFQAMVADVLEHAPTYAHWHGRLPALLRRPTHWHGLNHKTLPELKRAETHGNSYLLNARVRSVEPAMLVHQRVEWACLEAREERSDCWACKEAAQAGTSCSISIPSEFLTDLPRNQDSKRVAILEKSLQKAARCAANPVVRLQDPEPLRACQVVEVLPLIERVPEAATLLIRNDKPLNAGKEYEFEVRSVRSRYSGRLALVSEDFFPTLSPEERFRPHGPELDSLSDFVIHPQDGQDRIGALIDAQTLAFFEKLHLRKTAGNFRMVRWFWLLYASPYCIPNIGGIHRGGASSIFIIGDTSLGKSFCLEQMAGFLQMGRKADSKATSATGLLAIPRGDQVAPGEIPELDRKLLVVSEAHALDPAIWQDLRDARRDGLFVYRKLATGTFRTRTRLAFVANPPGLKKMADFAHPWDTVPYLHGPDLARFDLFLSLARDPVDGITPRRSPFAVETLRRLVAHNWSKECHEPARWKVSDDTLDLVQKTASELRAAFGIESFPLLLGEQVEGMVLSWATAASNLAMLSVGPDLLVGPAHVAYVRDLLIENARSLGLQPKPSLAPVEAEALRPVDALVREIRGKSGYLAVARAFTDTAQLNLEDLAIRTKSKAETLRKNVVPWFRKKGLLISKQGKGGGIQRTQLLTEVLELIERR